MTEKELLDKIKKSAEYTKLPGSISPEQISSILNSKKAQHFSGKHFFAHIKARSAASAAAVLLFCGTLSGAAYRASKAALEPSSHAVQVAQADTSMEKSSGRSDADTPIAARPKQNAGTLYTVAENYEQVYEKLKSYNRLYTDSIEIMKKNIALTEEGVAAESAPAEEFTVDAAAPDASAGESYAADLGTGAAMKNKAEAETEGHSTTNLQTEGVDESDITKTDGRYIYTVSDRKILITDTAGEDLKPAGTVDPGLDASDSILELYVDNGSLTLLVQHSDTILEEETAETDPQDTAETKTAYPDVGIMPLEESAAADTAETKARYISTNYSVMLYVYDVADPANPILKGTGNQQGFYYTSRKIGNVLYLFTQKQSFAQPAYYRDGTKEAKDSLIPCVNGKEIPYDHIYLPPSEGGSGLILSSFRLDAPNETIDEVMIVNDYANVYVGNNAIYLYNTDYSSSESLTQIAKFEMNDGAINAIDAASAKGEIYDTFAINEYKNTLRVLTTSYDGGSSSNHLFLFDEQMKLASSLDGIAKGEEIYAARYLGDTAYFITYHNTDPLFAVDISDIKSPKILGELKITGFSEYLHFWGDGRLLGIGYETDPETGNQQGIKLVMFDISNPAELKVIDSMVLKEYYFSPALYNYKCVLADPAKNLIGFAAEFNSGKYGYLMDYNVYAWEDGHFVNKLAERLPDLITSDSVRGIYIGDRFYIAGLTEITGFDMNDNFKKQWHLQLTP